MEDDTMKGNEDVRPTSQVLNENPNTAAEPLPGLGSTSASGLSTAGHPASAVPKLGLFFPRQEPETRTQKLAAEKEDKAFERCFSEVMGLPRPDLAVEGSGPLGVQWDEFMPNGTCPRVLAKSPFYEKLMKMDAEVRKRRAAAFKALGVTDNGKPDTACAAGDGRT